MPGERDEVDVDADESVVADDAVNADDPVNAEEADDPVNADPVVADALAAAFPNRVVDEIADAGLSWNEGNRTVAVDFANGERAYLKVAVDGDPTRVAREAATLQYANGHSNAPVPIVLASDRDRDEPYIATADVDATVGWKAWRDADGDGRAAIARALGRTLAETHACRFDAHGHVVGGDANGLDLDTGPWTDVLLDTIAFTREQAGDGRFAHHFDAVVDLVEDDRDRLDAAPAALLHGDPARPNTYVERPSASPDDDRLAVGLLDWELAHVGDPVREIRRATRQFVRSMFDTGTDRHADALLDGYRAVAGDLPEGYADRAPLYDAVTYLGVSGFFEKWEGEFDTPTEEIAADVAAKMERRLDVARDHR